MKQSLVILLLGMLVLSSQQSVYGKELTRVLSEKEARPLLARVQQVFASVGERSAKNVELGNLVGARAKQGDRVGAIKYSLESLAINDQVTDSLLDIRCLIKPLDEFAISKGQSLGLQKDYADLCALNNSSRSSGVQSVGLFYSEKGEPAIGHYYLLQALDLCSNNIERANVLRELADCSFNSGNMGQARSEISEALKFAPEDINVLCVAADIAAFDGDAARAVQYLNRVATGVNPDSKCTAEARLCRAELLNGNRANAEKLLESALDAYNQQPNKAFFKGDFKFYLGLAEAALGKNQSAIRHLSEGLSGYEALNYLTGMCEARLNRGLACIKMGDTQGALEDFKFAEPHLSNLPFLNPIATKIRSELKLSTTEMPAVQERWALVVGVSEFADKSIPKLRYAAKDADDVRQFLVNELGFKSDHVRLLVNNQATQRSVLESLGDKWLPTVAGENDLVFLFISSHGTPAYKDVGAMNYVVAHDTQKEHLFTTGIPMQQISDLIARRVKAKRAYIVMDTCYSGATGLNAQSRIDPNSQESVDPAKMISSNTQLVVCASNTNQRSWESRRYANGVFTKQLMEVLSANKKFDDFHKLFPSLVEKVSKEVEEDEKIRQTPVIAGTWTGKGLSD